MKSLKIKSASTVKLSVDISSIANVGSVIVVDDKTVMKSKLYSFSKDLGRTNDLKNSMLSSTTNCFVKNGNAKAVMENSIVTYTLTIGGQTETIVETKQLITDNFFIVYFIRKIEVS